MKRIGWVSSASLFCALTAVPVMKASIFGTDVPGDGVSVCSQPGVTSGLTTQPDGLTVSMVCPMLVNSCSVDQRALLSRPTGPPGSTLNPADLSPTTSTFGDLLRFTNLNIAPGGTGTFMFFVTDYK